jgi:uncharacterized protein YdhG (YjbR/CyaY superfamily)
MKKKSPGSSSSKKSIAPATVQGYTRRIPASSRKSFAELRAAILAAVPADAVETISYRIPAIRRGKVLVWFAAFADHCSLFPTASVVAAFKDQLKNYSTSKGTVHFPLDKRIPAALVKKLVKARVAENAMKKRY